MKIGSASEFVRRNDVPYSDVMKPTRVVLVRHAEGQYSLDRVVGGIKGCTGLSLAGREQAKRLQERLARTEPSPDLILTSLLERAIETAALATTHLAAAVRSDCRYCEVHVGEADGLTIDEARSRWGWPGPWTVPPSGAETVATFGDRVADAVRQLVAEQEGQTTWLFTHGGFISAACYWFLGVPWQPESELKRQFFLDPSHVGVTEWSRDSVREPWVLHRYNDTGHLE